MIYLFSFNYDVFLFYTIIEDGNWMKDLNQIFKTFGYSQKLAEPIEMVFELVDELCKNDIEPYAQEMDEIG